MYKHLLLTASVLFLCGCSILSSETHNKYNDIPQTDIVIDTESIDSPGEAERLTIHVLEDGKPVDNADITLLMRAAKEAEVWNEEYDVSHEADGKYTAELKIPRDGLYLVTAHIKSDNIDAIPTKYFTVGELDMFEEVFLQEFRNDGEVHSHSHH
ncbi:hypothetical protein GCM10007275_14390 [Jeotgalicoccus coquinae]|uniref:YtkA-like domain-containing protein n=1 Tax=Jeotgalicoccus coquinae TaxID=709509 RepID=A0A6V7R335_9STAP|nr:FixH family protein [Jeotgalicoccus coquinae]MBB6423515.1 hypothetical protein [Jeotgalicoccus coquinae]GGE20426.1 hypothetical protein GCM10007275_14390 [Jeotgalicoccus coquinae]CAD2071545.1 hypothetical protein JEOCOQ751_00293 [Jeotgalicoccus coquinae]